MNGEKSIWVIFHEILNQTRPFVEKGNLFPSHCLVIARLKILWHCQCPTFGSLLLYIAFGFYLISSEKSPTHTVPFSKEAKYTFRPGDKMDDGYDSREPSRHHQLHTNDTQTCFMQQISLIISAIYAFVMYN